MRKINLMRALPALFAGLLAASPALAATATRVSTFEYDPASGLLTKEIVEPDQTQFRLETTYTYDAFGNRTAATVSSPATGQQAITSRTSSTGFDTTGRFATTATNALNQSETRSFHAGLGVATGLTGPNGLTTTWSYDGFGRKTLETRSDGTKTKYEYLWCSGVNGGSLTCPTVGGAAAKYALKVTPLASDGVTANGPYSLEYRDALDRPIRKTTQSLDGTLVHVDSEYDSLARVKRASRPYFDAGTVYWTTPTYDLLNRVTYELQPDGSFTTFFYEGLTTAAANSLWQKKATTKNSQNQVTQVQTKENLTGGNPANDIVTSTITYAYDPFGNVLTTTDTAGNQTTAQYDIRGRRTQLSDPSLGVRTFVYNVLGELVSQTDAKTQTTTFTYDLLGRMLTRTEPGLTSTWVYDAGGAAAKAVGKLTSATTNQGYSRSYVFDAQGRTSTITATLESGAGPYTTTMSYDAQGRLEYTTSPSGVVQRNIYNTLGFHTEVRNHSTNQSLWTLGSVNADGSILFQTFGDGVTTTKTYEAASGRLATLKTKTSQSETNNLVNLTYEYDTIGNMRGRDDQLHGLRECFQYDTLNRLTQVGIYSSGPTCANGTYSVTQSMTYNAVGNILTKSDVGTYSYPTAGTAKPFAVSSISGTVNTSFVYDANGNMSSGNGRTIAWTAWDMPSSITRGASTVTFTYGPEHQRIKQVAPAETTQYISLGEGMHVERMTYVATPGLVRWVDYVYAAGGMVGALYKETLNGVNPVTWRSFFHKDHLGSIVGITGMNKLQQTVLEKYSFDAWGRRRFTSGAADPSETITASSNRGYTTHEHLEEVGLVHMNGRVYDPLIARFVSADPFVQDPTNSQGLNRYSYVNNSPLMSTDPSGYFLKKLFKKAKWLAPILAIATAALVAWAMPYVLPAVFGNSGLFTAPVFAVFGGGAEASIIGATLTGAGKLLTGAIAGFAGGFVGSAGSVEGGLVGAASGMLFAGAGIIGGEFGTGAGVGAHAAAGCVSAVASKGNCATGAISSVVSKIGTLYVEATLPKAEWVGKMTATAVIGGTATAIAGGKFQNGAMSAAFGYLFNQALSAANSNVASPGLRVGPRLPGALGLLALIDTIVRAGFDGDQGIVYLRVNQESGDRYVGRADSTERFWERQAEHDSGLEVKHIYTVLQTEKTGIPLRVAEESWIRQLGGIVSRGGQLINARHEMNDIEYRLNGGRVRCPYPGNRLMAC